MPPTYSFVIPIHDETESIPLLVPELLSMISCLDGPAEVILVDDGSSDGSYEMLVGLHATDARFKVVHLARNFGHQVAVTAGVAHASGEAVITMDADLQDPPEVALEMVAHWREGSALVYGRRTDRTSDTWVKRSSAAAFYRLIGRMSSFDLPEEVGDFRLMDRSVVDALQQMPERNRYLRGMVASLGFDPVCVDYARPPRQAGTTSYTVRNMCRLASDGLLGFSKAPLHWTLGLGTAALAAGCFAALGAVGAAPFRRRRTPSLERAALYGIGGGVHLMAIGVVGEYVGRIHDEALARPLYTVHEVHGFSVTTIDLDEHPVVRLTEESTLRDRTRVGMTG